MSVIDRFFTWWNGHTVGTMLFTRRHGQFVGEDAEGNRFFQTSDGARRWVIYNGEAEASRITPDWHGWMHHTFDAPPAVQPLPRKPWEKGHLPNRTGTDLAYRPPGSVLTPARRPRAGGDYQPWTPE